MTAAMAGFAVSDMFIKLASAQLGIGYILLIMGCGGVPIFLFMAARAKAAVFSRAFFHPAVIARNLSEVVGTYCIITALSLIPLSTVSIIIQVNPIVVTLGAALFLGAPVGPWRWGAIIVGFLGVLLILNPASAEMDPNVWYALVAVMGLAGRDLATRKAPSSIPTLALATYGFMMLIPLGLLIIVLQPSVPQVDTRIVLLMLATITSTVSGYYAITAAMRVGDIATVTPFRYTRILFGVALGMLVFGEKLPVSAIIGVLIVCAAGTFIVLRERRLAA
jgi:drug/metabolite transporter (DMT)-like permease